MVHYSKIPAQGCSSSGCPNDR